MKIAICALSCNTASGITFQFTLWSTKMALFPSVLICCYWQIGNKRTVNNDNYNNIVTITIILLVIIIMIIVITVLSQSVQTF